MTASSIPSEAIGCPGCGAVQGLPLLPAGASACCAICATPLERTGALDAALAVSAATLLLLIGANLAPLFRVELLGAARESHMFSGVVAFWREGWPLPALCVFGFAVLAPLVRFALLTVTLVLVQTKARPPWLGRIFRYADRLTIWAMPDVLFLGLWVAYGRLHALFSLQVESGAYLLAASAAGTLLTRALLDRRAVWRAISPDAAAPNGAPTLSCRACDLLVSPDHANGPCPRCGAKLEARAAGGMAFTLALVGAGAILYLPANLLPMAATIQFGKVIPYTVLEGVRDLAQANLWGLAILVFTASFAIPLLKLSGLAWLVQSVERSSRRRLPAKNRVFRFIREIGRWSMVDIFAMACFLPLMQFGRLAGARAMAGASAFLMVVLLTMLASEAFDPRRMWDSLGGRR